MKKMDVKYEVSIPEGRVDTDDHYCPSIYVCKNLDEIKSFKDVFCYESDYEPKNVLNMATMISENCAAIGRLDQIPIFVIYTQPGDTESLCSTENFASAYHFDLYSAGALGMTRYLPMGKVILDPYMGINDLNEMLQEIEDSANSVGLNSYRGILYIRMEGYSYEDISLENKLLMYIVRKLLNKNYTHIRAVFDTPKEIAQNLSDLLRKETGIMCVIQRAESYQIGLFKEFFQRMLMRGLCVSEFTENRTVDQKVLEDLIPEELRTPACLDEICNEFYLNFQWGNKKRNIENILKAVNMVKENVKHEKKIKIGFM